MLIPFNRMTCVGNEEKYLLEALKSGRWCGRGPATLRFEAYAREIHKVKHLFFVTSCTSALELSCLLAGVGPGDEVIVPSFGFVSAANAVVLRGATPVFADVDLKTWNLSLSTVLPLVNKKTKAVLTVHYGGSTAGVEELRSLCADSKIFFIEDAAQSLGAKKNGKLIGPTPWTTCFSLHETKNISCGEGGLIMTDSADLASKIEIHIEKGTDRQRFIRGEVDKYTWHDQGSSFIASDLLAALALAQLEKLDEITRRRQELALKMRVGLANFEGKIFWQSIPAGIETNGHVAAFCVDPNIRQRCLSKLREKGLGAVSHYVALHESPYATKKGFNKNDLPNTKLIAEGLVRLPIFFAMTDQEADEVIEKTSSVLKSI